MQKNSKVACKIFGCAFLSNVVLFIVQTDEVGGSERDYL